MVELRSKENKLFLALTDRVSVKVVSYKRCKFCPVFFALSTTEEASHSWGEMFGDQKRHRLMCGELLEKNDLASSLKNYTSLSPLFICSPFQGTPLAILVKHINKKIEIIKTGVYYSL